MLELELHEFVYLKELVAQVVEEREELLRQVLYPIVSEFIDMRRDSLHKLRDALLISVLPDLQNDEFESRDLWMGTYVSTGFLGFRLHKFISAYSGLSSALTYLSLLQLPCPR